MKIIAVLAAVALSIGGLAAVMLASGLVANAERGEDPSPPGIDHGLDSPRDGQDPKDQQYPDDGTKREVVEAPIDSIEIVVRESYPPQYGVHIVSGLPSGCASFHGLTVERDGDIIVMTVTNTMPTDPDVVCTMIYGMKEHDVDLGSDFVSGETYTVIVNGEAETFVAQ